MQRPLKVVSSDRYANIVQSFFSPQNLIQNKKLFEKGQQQQFLFKNRRKRFFYNITDFLDNNELFYCQSAYALQRLGQELHKDLKWKALQQWLTGKICQCQVYIFFKWLLLRCMKSVSIWSFSGLCFLAFGLNTERKRSKLFKSFTHCALTFIRSIQSECGKYGPEKLRRRTLFTQC